MAERGAWLADSKFAMFIHWGPYSQLGGRWQGRTYYGIAEWIMNRAQISVADYEAAARSFNPTAFDAAEWVELARAAGMRHMMITAKHHDGFAMFASAASGYNIAHFTPFGRDPLRELADACAAGGLRFGCYYSQTADWHEPDAVGNTWDFESEGRDFRQYLHAKAMPQIEELLRGYGLLAGIWFDTPGPITPEESRLLVDLVHELQPDCLVNSRIGNDLGDYDSLGDQEIPRLPRAGLWETPDTSNDTWAYAWYDHNWKSPRQIAERLVRIVSRGGTYLLNVGPDGTGRIPEQCARILREVGRWVHAHEAAIHGASASPLALLPWGECTARGRTLYLHILQWPADGRLIVPGLTSPVAQASLDGVALPALTTSDGVFITLPPSRSADLIPVVTLQLAADVEANRDCFVLGGCENVLETGLAERQGCELRGVSWMEKFGDWHHAECLGGWQGADSQAAWRFRTVAPASFYLDIEYTCGAEDDYAEWRVCWDGEEVTFPLVDSGEREHRAVWGGELPRFRIYRVGMVEFPAAGEHVLSLGPTGAAGLGVRVAGVRLTPVV
jgi:alpha-L-fucosidase